MDVNKDNFDEVCQEIEELLPTCEFYSIDEEMSGIHLSNCKESRGDIPEVRYQKMKQVASYYNIIQFGICLWHKASEAPGDYKVRAYNVYTFPETGSIKLDGSAITFLKGHNMDFQKWFYEGVPYATAAKEEEYREKYLTEKPKQVDEWKRKKIKLTKEEDIEFVKGFMEGVKTWNESSEISEDEVPEYKGPDCNSFLRLCVRQEIEEQYPEIIVESRALGTERWKKNLVLTKLSDKQKEEKAARVLEEKKTKFNSRLGFRRIFKAMINSKKPIVGHNCLYDFLFMMAHFQGVLPATLTEFKELTNSLFPVIYDTKYLCSQVEFSQKTKENPEDEKIPIIEKRFSNGTALGNIYEIIKNDEECLVKCAFPEKFNKYSGGAEAFHEAAYDAYITGFAFADFATTNPALVGTDSTPYLSVFNIFRGMHYLNMKGEDIVAHKGELYLLSEFSETCQTSDLVEPFQEVTGNYVVWIDGNSAFLVVPSEAKEQTDKIVEKAGFYFKVSSFAEWLEQEKARTLEAMAPKRPVEESSSEAPPAKKQKV